MYGLQKYKEDNFFLEGGGGEILDENLNLNSHNNSHPYPYPYPHPYPWCYPYPRFSNAQFFMLYEVGSNFKVCR